MIVGRLDDRDVQIGKARQHTRRDGDTARAAADDDDVVALRLPLHRRCASDDLGAGGEACCLGGERHAFSATAVSQNRLRQFGDRCPESGNVSVRHLSGNNRDMAALETHSGGLLSNFGAHNDGKSIIGGLSRPLARLLLASCRFHAGMHERVHRLLESGRRVRGARLRSSRAVRRQSVFPCGLIGPKLRFWSS
jgi:hypothetical protein